MYLNDNISLLFARIFHENTLKNMIERASNFIVQPRCEFCTVLKDTCLLSSDLKRL